MATGKIDGCSHEACGCTSEATEGITARGQWWCSPACVEGKGCEHAGCGCGQRSGDAASSATAPAQPQAPTKPAPAHNPGPNVDFNPAQGGPATRRQP